VVTVTHGDGPSDPIAVALGERLVTAHGGRVTERREDASVGTMEIALPR
jgi:hypothetical protein